MSTTTRFGIRCPSGFLDLRYHLQRAEDHGRSLVSVLHRRLTEGDLDPEPFNVDDKVALAPLDFLAGVAYPQRSCSKSFANSSHEESVMASPAVSPSTIL